MRIPKSLSIRGRMWKVVQVADLVDEDCEKVHGLCEWETRTIEIEKKLPLDRKTHTFLHELTHAIMSESFVTDAEGGIPIIVQEVLADNFAEFFTSDAVKVTFQSKRKK